MVKAQKMFKEVRTLSNKDAVFHKGFSKGANSGKGATTRSMQTVNPKKGAGETVQGRMVRNASKPLTTEKMRKPFG